MMMNYQEYVEYIEGLFIEANVKKGYPSHLILEDLEILSLHDLEQYLLKQGYKLM
jgi:hypothetical protein